MGVPCEPVSPAGLLATAAASRIIGENDFQMGQFVSVEKTSGKKVLAPGLALGLAILATACVTDRPRPDPTALPQPAVLQVEVRRPINNATVFGARPMTLEVSARDLLREQLAGIGFVVRRAENTLDSAVVRFAARTDSTHAFTYEVPDVATNTQLDIYGIAFGTNGETLVSERASIVVVRCQPQFPGC